MSTPPDESPTPGTAVQADLRIGRRVFLAAIFLLVTGSAAFLIGIAAAFDRAGNWSNHLAEFGIALWIFGGALNLAACAISIRIAVRHGRITLWGCISLIGVAGMAYAIWVALHL